MKSLKKTLVLLVVLSMILSAVSPVFAFNDVIAEEYAEQANKMAAFGVFTGDANGNFNAEENITRAEMAVVIGRLMGLTTNEANANQGYASNFSDVNAGEWYTGWVNLVAGRGIISGFPDGTFRPNEKVTQAQAVTMIVKALGWGVVVDQTGTWPANYITKASELRLFKDAVDTNSELVTRGNVAIYCYNALTAKMWDVTESTNGELTSSRTADTILAKYFSDFVNEDGDMKLVEDAKVSVSGATTSAIGANQVKIDATDIATFIDAENAPRKDKEEVTYKVSANSVVAYVPASVANIANLAGKTVDVIFGEDNEVAYLVVTDDATEAAYVTAFDAADEEIEIDGTVYDVADDVTVTVYNYEVGTGIAAITTLFETGLSITDPAKYMTRNVIAETILNADDEVETINFKFSAAYTKEIETDEDLVVAEYVVEKISSKNVATCADGTKLDLEDIEEDDEPRVIRNGEIAELTDIEVGDVLTTISYNGVYMTVVAIANTVEGELADYMTKTKTYEIDGENYVVVANVYYNENGEDDDFESDTASSVYSLFDEETVTAYLNMAGEVVAVIGESEATGTVLGVITDAAELDEDSDDVEYLKLRILAEDGTEKRYSIYNKKSSKDITDAAEYGSEADQFVVGDLTAGKVIKFEADEDRVIASDDIEILASSATENDKVDLKSNTGLLVTEVAYNDNSLTVDEDDKTVTMTIAGESKEVRFNSATKVLNVTEEELISSWSVLTNGDAFVENEAKIWFFTKGTKIMYMIVAIEEANYGASDAQYGILVDVDKDKDEDDETIYIATVVVDGVEKTFECDESVRDYEYGCFVSFRVSDGEFKEKPTVLVEYDFIDYLADLDDDAEITDYATYTTLLSSAVKVEAIKVDSVEVVDGETYLVFESEDTEDLAKGYIVYNLADGEEVSEVSEGDYVVTVDADADEDGMEIVIVLN